MTTTARDSILGAIRCSLGRGPLAGPKAEVVRRRLAEARPILVPARATGAPDVLAERFATMAEDAGAEVIRLDGPDALPAAIHTALAEAGFAPDTPLAATTDPLLADLETAGAPPLVVTRRPPGTETRVGLAVAEAGIAETGTVMLCSGPGRAATLTVLPDLHLVVLPLSRIVGGLEDAWRRLRPETSAGVTPCPPSALPRTVHLVTGPSRTGDIEQTLQLGAHGPLRLRLFLIDDTA